MTILTTLAVTETCSFRWVLEEKIGKEISKSSRSEFLEKFLANNFALSAAEDNNFALLNRGGVAGITNSNFLELLRATFLETDVFFCFISISQFGSFKNPFLKISSLSELYFRFRRLIMMVQTKNWFLWTMVVIQAAENHGDERALTWYLWWGIYIHHFQPEPTHSQNSIAAAEALSLKISSHETFLKRLRRLQNFPTE